MNWEQELNTFITFYESEKETKVANAKGLASIETIIKTTVEKVILDASCTPNLAVEDKAIIACLKVAAKMLKPAKERIDLAQATKEIKQITI